MRALPIFLVLLVGCGAPAAGGGAAPTTRDNLRNTAQTIRCEAGPESFARLERCLDGDAMEVARLLVRAAQLERTVPEDDRLGPEAYHSLFTDTATGRTFARRLEPEASDWTLTPTRMVARIEGSRAQLWHGAEAGIREIEITVDGERAGVLARLGISNGVESLDDEWTSAECVRRAGTWRIERLRGWYAAVSNQVLFQEFQPDPRILYDETHWRAADRWLAEARAAFAAAQDPEARRRLVLALRGANRIPEAWAAARELTDSGDAHSADWRTRTELAVSLGRLGDAHLSAERGRAAPPPPAEEWASMDVPCDDEDEDGEEVEAHCRFHLLHRRASSGDSPITVAVLRMHTGVAEPAGRILLAVAWEGQWQTLAELGTYVMAGNVPVGPIRFDASALELTTLDEHPDPEFRAEYEEVTGVEDGGSTRERGVLVCARLRTEPRCARFPREVERRDAEGSRTSGARAEVRFEDAEVITRRLEGRDARIRAGRRTLADVFDDAEPSGISIAH